MRLEEPAKGFIVPAHDFNELPGKEYYGRPCMVRVCTAVPPKELERSLDCLLEAARRRGLAR